MMKGNQTLSCVCDPQGVGTGLTTYPRVFGAAPLDLWLGHGHPQGVPAPTNPARQVPDPAFIALSQRMTGPAYIALSQRGEDPTFIALYQRMMDSAYIALYRRGEDPAFVATYHRPADPAYIALSQRGGGSRQGSTLHSHRSSRNSGDDLWTDHRPDLDPLAGRTDNFVSIIQ